MWPKSTSLKSKLPSASSGETSSQENVVKEKNVVVIAKRSSIVIFTLFVLVIYGSWGVYWYQFQNLPAPLTLEHVGKRGFSEHEAMKHVEALTRLGPHPVGSDALESALKYVAEAAENIKKTAHLEVDVEVDLFHAHSGAHNLGGDRFKGKTLVYSDLNHIVLRIMPKYASEAGERAILVSSHIDTVFSGEGAGDCSSCVSVMLELARGVSQWAHGFKNAVIFLFNTGEEEGLNGAHSFISQHPWSDTIQIAIDLEAMGIGGMSTIFQAGPHPWAVENFAMVAKYPSAQIFSEDLFNSGAINSATDFQVYQEVAGLSGLDFAYVDNTAVYHTKNDKLKLLKLKPGSLQHLGENMLAFLLHAGASSSLPENKALESEIEASQDKAIYFDILGTYMITFRQRLANMIYNSVILLSLMLLSMSVLMGGYSAAISLALSCLSLVLMWIFSISFSSIVAVILPFISSSPVPFVSSPWLVIGLFGAPALLGAFTGQHIGFRILESYLARTMSERRRNLSASLQASLAKLDAERWVFKSGLVQWLVLLMVGNYSKFGASYLALAWLATPAFAYGFLEASLSPTRLPKPLKTVTMLIGMSVPFLLTSGMIIRLSLILSGLLSALYETANYRYNDQSAFNLSACRLGRCHQPFSEDTVRAVNVVHVVDATGINDREPVSYISLFSTTPGNLNKEADQIGEGFVCGRDKHLDFVTFVVNYSCWSDKNSGTGWLESDVPAIRVEKDAKGGNRETQISIDTRVSTRWSLGINTDEIKDFRLTDTESFEALILLGEKIAVDGWHTIRFAGGKKSPTKFTLSLFWHNQTTSESARNERLLLKLRTDVVDRLTPPM